MFNKEMFNKEMFNLGADVVHAGDEVAECVSETGSKSLRLLDRRLGEEPEKQRGLLNRREPRSPIRRQEVAIEGLPHDVAAVGEGDGLQEDGHGDHGDLGVGGVEDLPHGGNDVVVLQPDEQPSLFLARLKQHLVNN